MSRLPFYACFKFEVECLVSLLPLALPELQSSASNAPPGTLNIENAPSSAPLGCELVLVNAACAKPPYSST